MPHPFLAQKTFVILTKRWPNKNLFLGRPACSKRRSIVDTSTVDDDGDNDGDGDDDAEDGGADDDDVAGNAAAVASSAVDIFTCRCP